MAAVDYKHLYAHLYKRAMEIIEQDKKEVEKCYQDAVTTARKEVSSYLEKRLGEIYLEAINNFYNDYSPNKYLRNESLYDMLDLKFSDGVINKVGFDETQMTTFRSGYQSKENGLYRYVFRQGWHGGAPKNGNVNGTKYYRTGSKYSRWGAVAKRAAIAPYDEIKQKVDAARASGGEFDMEFKRLIKENFNKNLAERRR